MQAIGGAMASAMQGVGSLVNQPAVQSIVKSSVVVTIPAADAFLTPIAEDMKLEYSMLKYMVCIFAAYPIALIFGLLPNTKHLKHTVSFLVGFVMVQWTFGPDWFHSFFTAAMTYAVCMFAPRKIMGPLAFWLVLAYMVAAHAYKMYTNSLSGLPYWQFPLDFTGCQMVLTMKLTSFAYNVADGANFRAADKAKGKGMSAGDDDAAPAAPAGTRRSPRSHSKSASSRGKSPTKSPAAAAAVTLSEADAKKAALKAKVEASRREFALDRLPNLLEYFGYVYCFSCIMVGPTFEYSTYEKCVLGGNQEDSSVVIKKDTAPAAYMGPGFNTPIHGIMAWFGRFFNCNRYVAAVHRLLLALVCMGGYKIMQALGYSSYHGYDPVWIAANPSHIAKYAFMFTTMFSERLKFYFIWKAAEGSCILGGFGFSGYDKNGHSKGYRAAENMDILGHELATSVQILSRGWNKGTQGWLERYTFHRHNRSLFITYFISAVWHGVYPGFLLMFMCVPILTSIERLFQQKISPRVVPEYDGRNLATYPTTPMGYVYWFACMFGMKVSMNYLTQTFSMGFWENAWTAWSSYDHIPHYVWLVMWIVLTFAVKSPKKKAKTV